MNNPPERNIWGTKGEPILNYKNTLLAESQTGCVLFNGYPSDDFTPIGRCDKQPDQAWN